MIEPMPLTYLRRSLRTTTAAGWILFFAVTLAIALTPAVSQADQDPSKIPYRGAPETRSIGQPARTQAIWGPSLGYNFDAGKVSGRVNLGINAELLMPQVGFLDFTVEGTLGFVGSDLDGALSTYLKFPYLNPGMEYNFADKELYFKLTAIGAPRRGGIFGIGDRIRLDWVPATGLVQVGLAIEQPFGKYHRNRPMNRHVYLNKVDIPVARGLDENLVPHEIISEIKESITWMDLLYNPRLGLYDPGSNKSLKKFDERASELLAHIQDTGRNFWSEDSLYHENLIRAFAFTVGGDTVLGESMAREAERITLERVVIPTNRLFGRMKKPVDITSFVFDASLEFAIALGRRNLTPPQSAAATEVLREVHLQINEIAKIQHKRWDDSRLVWLPLNYGLRPEQYDSQSELNQVIEKVVGLRFTQGNDIGYLFSDDFFYFYKNLLLETEYYQVTIIHDFRNKTGPNFDRAAWEIVADGYIEAFIQAIEAMDRGEREILPEFIMFLDEYYYRVNKSREIITFLENLSEEEPVYLAAQDLQAKVRAQQLRLKEVIAASTALDRFDKDYVKRNVRVHINITHQFDPTFKEDAVARDHRKLVFRDVFEEDPGSGVAVFTGAGIGEHYVGPTWEDRSLLLRGPDLVKVKNEARQLFLYQGYSPDDVPFYLRERPFPADYAARCARLVTDGWTADALTTMNQPGFREKIASVAKMAIYNLMSRGSVILAPDSIWASDFWASVFIGNALRGVHVYAIAPTEDSAPSAGAPTLELVRESLASMLRSVEVMGKEMEDAGGSLHVGVFVNNFDVCDPLSRVEVFLQEEENSHLAAGGLNMHPQIREVYAQEREFLLSQSDSVQHITDYGENRHTKLHQKTQFFVTREGIEVLNRPEWATFLAHYLEHHRERCKSPDRSLEGVQSEWLGSATKPLPESRVVEDAIGNRDSTETKERLDRVAFFLTVGSQNQDRRGMLLDGEVLVVVPGYDALISIMDFAFVLRSTKWLDCSMEINEYYPRASGLLKTVSRWIKNLI